MFVFQRFTMAMSLSTWHLVLLETPGTFQFRNMVALEANGFQIASCLILCKAFAVYLRLFFSVRFLRPCWLLATKRLNIQLSRHHGLVISRVLHPSERYFTIFDSSESVKSLFWPILPEVLKLRNIYAHLIWGVNHFRPHPSSLHKQISSENL